MSRLLRLLCLLGIHSWRRLDTVTFLVDDDETFHCTRCSKVETRP